MEFKWAKDKERQWEKLTIEQALPGKFQRWTQGLKGQRERMKEGLKTTPFFMSIPGRAQFPNNKKQQRKNTKKFYAPKIVSMLNPNNQVRYYIPNDKQEAF